MAIKKNDAGNEFRGTATIAASGTATVVFTLNDAASNASYDMTLNIIGSSDRTRKGMARDIGYVIRGTGRATSRISDYSISTYITTALSDTGTKDVTLTFTNTSATYGYKVDYHIRWIAESNEIVLLA